jgi:hypothetical protein
MSGYVRDFFRSLVRNVDPGDPAQHRGSFVLDTRGHVHGASVLVNGHELNDVVADVEIISRPGDPVPLVTLTVVPCEGLVAQLERADINVDTSRIREALDVLHGHRSAKDIKNARTIRDAAALIAYDRAGRKEDMELVAKLKRIAAALTRP